MKRSLLIFNLFSLLNILVVLSVQGLRIQLYRLENFTGLEWEGALTGDCSNIPRDKNAKILSIRTDSCFIAYYDPDCKPAVTEKYLAGDTVLSSNQLGRDGSIGSFHNCNEDEGGNQLNIDITEFQDPFSSGQSPIVLESYRNVCLCVNVPEYVQNMDEWSVNNHHNALLAYYELDCLENRWNSTYIAAGHNFGSHNMREHDKADEDTMSINPIQSLGPDKNSAYFQISCNSSYVTMESKNVIESRTENKMNVNAEFDHTGFQGLSSQIGELQTQVIELKRNQEMFYAIILEQLRNMTFSCNN